MIVTKTLVKSDFDVGPVSASNLPDQEKQLGLGYAASVRRIVRKSNVLIGSK